MEEQDLISKKELLQLTGISYGQLYRWKRENLIPEDWFIKKSSFTGQETFFPKDKILKRTTTILELKDKYSLEELGKIFSPQNTDRTFRPGDFEEIVEILDEVVEIFCKVFEKKQFSFMELTFIYLVSKIHKEDHLTPEDLKSMVKSIQGWLLEMKNTACDLILCENEKRVFTLLIQQDAKIHLDHRIREKKKFILDETAKELQSLLNDVIGGV